MSIERFPTLLGGKQAKLDWEDLNPDELLHAMHSSSVRAAEAISLAETQIIAAEELGDMLEAQHYTASLHVLRNMAGAGARRAALPLQQLTAPEVKRS